MRPDLAENDLKVAFFDTSQAACKHFAAWVWQVIKSRDTSPHVQQPEGIYE